MSTEEQTEARRRVRDLLKRAVSPIDVIGVVLEECARHAQDNFAWDWQSFKHEARDAFEATEART